MPVYNGAAYLEETLDSWLAQDFEHFELIASDNASSDATPDILALYARRDPRLRVLRRSKTVIAWENYNGLVPEARAPLFAWAACDDLRDPRFLSRLLASLDASPEAVLAYPRTTFIGDPHLLERHRAPPRTPGLEAERIDRLIALLRSTEWHVVYGLIRRSALDQTRLFYYPMGFNADCGLCMELATLGRFVHVPEDLLMFRLRTDSLSRDPRDPIHRGRRGRLLDAGALEFADGLELVEWEHRLFARELAVWCRKAQRPRHALWRSGTFRSLYVHAAHSWIDLKRRSAERAVDVATEDAAPGPE